MINRIGIEGIDGSGKSTVAEILTAILRAQGLKVVTFAPYRLANARLGHDIYDLWRDDKCAKAAVGVLRQVFEDCEEQATQEGIDVINYDRGWMTAYMEIGDRTDLQEAWGDYFPSAALLRTPPEVALARSQNDHNAAWSNLETLQRNAAAYDRLALANFHRMHGIYRSDNDVTPECIARAIESDMYYRR